METNLQLKLLKQALGWWVTPQTKICAETSKLGCQIYCNCQISAETTFHQYRAVHTTNLALSHLQVQGMDVSISHHCWAEDRTRSNVHILTKAWFLIFQHFTNQCCNLHWRKGNFNWWILSNFAWLRNFRSQFRLWYWGFYHGCIKLAYVSLS